MTPPDYVEIDARELAAGNVCAIYTSTDPPQIQGEWTVTGHAPVYIDLNHSTLTADGRTQIDVVPGIVWHMETSIDVPMLETENTILVNPKAMMRRKFIIGHKVRVRRDSLSPDQREQLGG